MEDFSILIVEDSEEHRLQIERALSGLYQLNWATSMEEAFAKLSARPYDLYLLDVVLPDGDGYQLCQWLRTHLEHKNKPIIFLSSRSEVGDRIHGLRLGAEDYICKPFDPEELKARIEVKFRHFQDSTSLRFGAMQIDLLAQKVLMNRGHQSEELSLTPREYRILALLARNPNITLTRDQIMKEVWGEGVHITDRSVDTHIASLRKKLGELSHYIRSIHGKGYMMSAPDASDSDPQSRVA